MTAPTAEHPLTAERALALLREVVAARPNHIYQPPDSAGCVYIDEASGEPSCLVSHVLIRAGYSAANLERQNRTSVLSLFLDGIDQRARDVLYRAQVAQDVGRSWAEALAAAEAEAAS